MPETAHPEAAYTLLAEAVIDIAREIQLRAIQSTPLVPLTPTQGQVMRFVHRHPGCTASDIADGAGLQRTNVSTALRELRSRGYLVSRRDDVDGRAIRIEATPLADENILALRASWASLVHDGWDAAPAVADADTLAVVTTTLAALRDRLGAARTGGDAVARGDAAIDTDAPRADGADGATKAFPASTPSADLVGADSSLNHR